MSRSAKGPAALLRQACLEVAAIAALAAAARIVPGLASAQRLAFGSAIDGRALEARQLRLLRELLELRAPALAAADRRAAERLLGRIRAAVSEGTGRSARELAEALAGRLAGELALRLARPIAPLVEPLAEAATAVLATVVMARRAEALAGILEARPIDLRTELSALGGLGEERLLEWTRKGAERVLAPLAAARGLGRLLRLGAALLPSVR
ncbi:MAG: hypothetical protein RML12_07415 [Xanthomonadales bacterium]|nr:hypothetical protein [Xanthomonadales bacterium]